MSIFTEHHIRYRKILWVFIVLVIGAVVFYAGRLLFLKEYATESSVTIYSQLEEARTALKNFDTETIQEALRAVDKEIRSVEATTEKYGVLNLATFWGNFIDRLKAVPQTFAALTALSDTAVHVSDDIADIKNTALELIVHKRGNELIEKLTGARKKIVTLQSYIQDIRTQKELSFEAQQGLISLDQELYRTTEALEALIKFLDSPKSKHIAVLFQNPSEIRPGGGFIGSFAHLELKQGNLENVSIHDIYDPDGQLAITVRPPRILDRITPTWGARDANWFFDFPASAEKVLFFLNNSKIYIEQGVSFDAALAINTAVLQDMIDLVGTIDLPEYDLTLTTENFLKEIQREVESGEDKARGEPKRILKVVTPIVLERLTALTDQEKQTLVNKLTYHLKTKNSMFYIRDRLLESYVQAIGFGGEVANTPSKRVNEYLAVVNANIAGGKSDAFVSQAISFKAAISPKGTINNTLTVTREHTGHNETEWWYRATNKNYLQIYTPVGSKALKASGQSSWPGPTAQKVRGASDDDIEIIEATRRFLDDVNLERFIAANKTVFAAWFNTPAGSTRTFSFTYQNPRPLLPELKLPYEFVFDKQSGAKTSLTVAVQAPAGYIWQETGNEMLGFQSDDPPSRVKLVGTLIPALTASAQQQAPAAAVQ